MTRFGRAWRWLVEYLVDQGFRRDAHCYGGLALLACGLALLYSAAHALIVVGALLFALPLLIGALSRRGSN